MEEYIILTASRKKRFAAQYRRAGRVFLRNKKRGLRRMIALCKKGNPNAAVFLYHCMLHGMSIAQKDEEIENFLRMSSFMMKRAADCGDDAFRYTLGRQYEEGKTVAKDPEKAFNYVLLAAKGGYRAAMSVLSLYYERGFGTQNSVEKSMYWQQEGIRLGCLYCKKEMGKRYQYGKGVPVDHALAEETFLKLRSEIQAFKYAEPGEVDYTQEELQNLMSFVEGKLEEMEIIRAFKEYENAKSEEQKEMKRNRIRKYADKGKWLGQFYMGIISEAQKDYKEALRWNALAAEQGSAGAKVNSGIIYYYGKGVEQDYRVAYDFFRKAAGETSNKCAMFFLGEMYEKGYYVKADNAKAYYWYREASLQGNKDAQKRLEKMNGQKV